MKRCGGLSNNTLSLDIVLNEKIRNNGKSFDVFLFFNYSKQRIILGYIKLYSTVTANLI